MTWEQVRRIAFWLALSVVFSLAFRVVLKLMTE